MKVYEIERGIQRGVISLYGYNILSLDMGLSKIQCHVKVNNELFDQLQLHLGFSLLNYAGPT